MDSLKERLRNDLTASMRTRNELRLSTLRMVLTAITNTEVAGATPRKLSDSDVLAVLTKEAKKRHEAADAFRDGGRTDRAEREEAEAGVIAEYLPAPLSDDELVAMVEAVVAETGASSPREMGAVMKVLQPRTAGRADGARVAAAVKARLQV
jgi:uncharacterized protein YqeY